jgi:hypothetical protein
MSSTTSDHSVVKPDINKRKNFGKCTNTWKIKQYAPQKSNWYRKKSIGILKLS